MSSNPANYPFLLSQSILFLNMTPASLLDLIQRGRIVTSEGSTDILVKGGRVPGLHLVIEGNVQITKMGEVVSQIGPGSFFGERTIFGMGHGATAHVTASSDCVVLVIERVALEEWFKAYPGMDGLFYKRLSMELANRLYGRA